MTNSDPVSGKNMSVSWGHITIREMLHPVGGTLIAGSSETLVAGISTDSRAIQEGDLFCALRGETHDGHDFVLKAMEKGAAGALVERAWVRSRSDGNRPAGLPAHFSDRAIIAVGDTLTALGDLAAWWRHQHSAKVVGITGSSGKTTTKEMTAGILQRGHFILKSQGNFNNLIGLPLTLLQLRNDHACAVVEMGMNHPGEIARLTEIADPNVGVILNVGMAHLEGLSDLDGVAKAKTEMIERISPQGLVILNGDDAPLMRRASQFSKRKITFGLEKANDVRAIAIQDGGPRGTRFFLEYRENRWPVHIRTPGLHYVKNALAAAAVALSLDEPIENIQEGLASFTAIRGRFEMIPLENGVFLVDDTYNANPSSLAAAIQSVESLVPQGGRILLGLGDMLELGDAAAEAHREAGRSIAKGKTRWLFVMGDHAGDTIQAAREAGMPDDGLAIVATHDEMVERIGSKMSPGDLVLLKGSRRMQLEKVAEGLRRWGMSHGAAPADCRASGLSAESPVRRRPHDEDAAQPAGSIRIEGCLKEEKSSWDLGRRC